MRRPCSRSAARTGCRSSSTTTWSLPSRQGPTECTSGRDDDALAAARSRLGAAATIGISCYDDAGRALAAARAGADYVAFGSFFPSVTKPGAVRATTDLAAAVRPSIKVPIVAIGGITAQNAPPLLASGIDLLAIVNALFGAPDIGRAARRLVRLFS